MERLHIIGQSQMGKTSLLQEFIEQDDGPFCVFDASGTITVDHDVTVHPSTTRWNPFTETVERNLHPNLFGNTITDMIGHTGSDRPLWLLNLGLNAKFVASAFIDNKRDVTDVSDFLLDQSFRDKLTVLDKGTEQYWQHFNSMQPREQTTHIASAYSMFASLLLDKRIRDLFRTSETKLSLSKITDKQTVVSLPVREYGEDTVRFVFSLFLAYLNYFAPDGYNVYIDDCSLIAPQLLTSILTHGKMNVAVSHQYLDQLTPKLRSAILGNCQRRYVFRVSKADADVLSVNLPPLSSKLSLDALPTFTYRTLPYDKSVPDGETLPLER